MENRFHRRESLRAESLRARLSSALEAEIDRSTRHGFIHRIAARTDTVIRRRIIINLRGARLRRKGGFIIQWRHVRVYALGHVSRRARHRRRRVRR